MDKITKYSLYSVGTVIALIVGGAVYVLATFDVNTLKPRLETLVKSEKQRTLKFNGPLGLSLFPRPGITLSDVSLSERNSDTQFAHIGDARLVMQFWPLLSKQIVIDKVDIQGATINLIKDKAGQYNFADLMETKKPTVSKERAPEILTDSETTTGAAMAPGFQLSQFNIAKSNISYRDLQSGQQLKLSDVSLFGDGITVSGAKNIDFSSRLQSPSPALDLLVSTKLDRLNFDSKSGQVLLDGLHNVLDGKVDKDALKLTLTAPKLYVKGNAATADTMIVSALLSGAERKVDANFKLDGVSGDSQQIKARALKLDLTANQADQAVKMTINSPLNFKVATEAISLAQLAIRGDVTAGGMKAIPVDLSGKLNAELKAQQINTSMKGSLDRNPLDFSADVKGFTNPFVRFDIRASSLDLNRYISSGQSAGGGGQAADAGAGTGSKAPATKVDLSGLSKLNLDGKVNLGQLRYAAMDARNVALAVNAQKGVISVPTFSLNAFGGSIAANGTATTTASPRITIKPTVSNVDIYALLKHFASFEKLEGRATVDGSLTMQGGDTTALKNSLTGNLNAKVTDGAWRGINIAKTIREARAAISSLKGGEQSVTANNVEKTDFTELTASILLNQGVATNKDLAMKSPLLRVSGEGEANLKTDNINYLLKAALVDTSKGQMGKERDQLHGVTVPIRIKGSMSAPKYSLDLTAAIKENAGAKLEEKKQEAQQKLEEKKQEAQQKLDEKKQEVQQKLEKKAGDALSEGLKKLF